jgi:dUTP pyrophosphatase
MTDMIKQPFQEEVIMNEDMQREWVRLHLTTNIKVKKLSELATIPSYQSNGAAGFDFHAAIEGEPIILKPGQRALIPTGLSFAIPLNKELQIRPRSGLAYKYGITVLNTPGTVDSDFRGEVKVLLINHGQESFTVKHGERIAQGVVAKVPPVKFVEVDELDETERGSGGFGHTGK